MSNGNLSFQDMYFARKLEQMDEKEKEKAKNKKDSGSKELASLLNTLASAQSSPGATPMGSDFASRVSALGAQGQSAVGQGAMQGAAMGASTGNPYAAAAGAALGVLQGMGRRKQAKRAIKAAEIQEKGRIEKEKEDKTAQVLGGIIANLRSAMLG